VSGRFYLPNDTSVLVAIVTLLVQMPYPNNVMVCLCLLSVILR
jgi:hypothetical protein